MISIIVPVFNAASTVDRVIKSILRNTYSDYEVILVDDGSTDDSLKIINELVGNNSDFKIFSKTNGGVSSARNMGISKATGDYIVFADADDEISSDSLENFASQIKDGIDMVVGSVTLVRSNGYKNHREVENKVLTDEDFAESFIDNDFCFMGPWGKLYRRSIIVENNLLFDETMKYSEDSLFVTNYLNYSNKIELMNKNVYFYYESVSGACGKYYDNLNEFLAKDFYGKIELINKASEEKRQDLKERYAMRNFRLVTTKYADSSIDDELLSAKVKETGDFYSKYVGTDKITGIPGSIDDKWAKTYALKVRKDLKASKRRIKIRDFAQNMMLKLGIRNG